MSKNKVLVIGLDGATWTVLSPLMEKGKMPTLKRLMEKGVSGVLKSTIPPLTPPAWASFQTGVYPGKHGVFDFLQYKSGSYPTFVSSKSLRVSTIWDILSRYGKKIILVGLPLTYPPPKINGEVISCLLTPSLDSEFTYPPELKEELLAEIKDYRFITPQDIFFSKGLNVFLKELRYTEEKRVEAAEYLLQKYPWDIAMIQFQSLDNLQHALWPYLDPSDENFHEEKRETVSNFFNFIDKKIERLIETAGEETDIIVMSDHGFCSLKKVVFLNKWLGSKKYLNLKESPKNLLIQVLIDTLKKIDFLKLRLLFLKPEKRANLSSSIIFELIDWPQTKAFMVGSTGYGGIYINLKGREPLGTVTNEEYGRLRRKLKDELLSFKDSKTSKNVVKNVYFKEEIFRGDAIDSAPDILVEPEEGYLFRRVFDSNEIFKINKFGKDDVGNHSREGIFVFSGPSFRSLNGIEAEIVDIPAIILAMFNIQAPSYFDGKVMDSIFKSKISIKQSKKSHKAVKLSEKGFTKEEEKEIHERLKKLGYL